MKNSSKSPSFPFLIHRNDAEIENEIGQMRERRADTAKRLTELYSDLCAWRGNPISLVGFFDYLFEDEHERQLLEMYRQANKIPQQVKSEKIKEVFHVPDYSSILQRSIFYHGYNGAILKFYTANGIKAAPITEKEKEAIIQKHSYFVFNEQELLKFKAAKLICEALNIVNFDINEGLTTNKTAISQIRQAVPDIAKYITANPDLTGSNKRFFSVNFAAFSQ